MDRHPLSAAGPREEVWITSADYFPEPAIRTKRPSWLWGLDGISEHRCGSPLTHDGDARTSLGSSRPECDPVPCQNSFHSCWPAASRLLGGSGYSLIRPPRTCRRSIRAVISKARRAATEGPAAGSGAERWPLE